MLASGKAKVIKCDPRLAEALAARDAEITELKSALAERDTEIQILLGDRLSEKMHDLDGDTSALIARQIAASEGGEGK